MVPEVPAPAVVAAVTRGVPPSAGVRLGCVAAGPEAALAAGDCPEGTGGWAAAGREAPAAETLAAVTAAEGMQEARVDATVGSVAVQEGMRVARVVVTVGLVATVAAVTEGVRGARGVATV